MAMGPLAPTFKDHIPSRSSAITGMVFGGACGLSAILCLAFALRPSTPPPAVTDVKQVDPIKCALFHPRALDHAKFDL
eukprot:1564263-Rhodomonas_salina.2